MFRMLKPLPSAIHRRVVILPVAALLPLLMFHHVSGATEITDKGRDGMGLLDFLGKSKWVNPVTKKTAHLNAGWNVSVDRKDGEETYHFASKDDNHVVSLFTVVEAEGDILTEASDSFFEGIAPLVDSTEGWTSTRRNDINIAEIKGRMPGQENKSKAIRAWISGGYVWEIVIISRAADAINADTKHILEAVELTTMP